jgi:hypothetical protein
MKPDHTLGFNGIHRFLDGLLGADMHAKRVRSLANATLGVVRTASLAVHTIGQGLALARGLVTKHAVKQVDQLLSNDGIDIDAILPHWVRHVVGSRSDIKVAMDWTDFDADKQTTIMLSLMTTHGRTTPLVWLTVDTATLKSHRNEYEYQVLVRLADMPAIRRQGLCRNGPRLRRSKTLPGAHRGAAFRLRHQLSRQHQGDGGGQ